MQKRNTFLKWVYPIILILIIALWGKRRPAAAHLALIGLCLLHNSQQSHSTCKESVKQTFCPTLLKHTWKFRQLLNCMCAIKSIYAGADIKKQAVLMRDALSSIQAYGMWSMKESAVWSPPHPHTPANSRFQFIASGHIKDSSTFQDDKFSFHPIKSDMNVYLCVYLIDTHWKCLTKYPDIYCSAGCERERRMNGSTCASSSGRILQCLLLLHLSGIKSL